MYDICIIGCGAAGMTAAIEAKKTNSRIKICILEKNSIAGKKILASGNGRCNLSNELCSEKEKVLSFFRDIGVLTKADSEGRIYPYSEQGAQVAEALENELKKTDVSVITNTAANDIAVGKNCFIISTDNKKQIRSRKLLIASGGKAGPQFGTTGDGYRWAKNLDLKVTRLAPVLTSVECEGDFSDVKGVRAKADIRLFKDRDEIFHECGEIQFTDYGLSGICVFNLSRELKPEENETIKDALKRYTVYIDFVPEYSEERLAEILEKQRKIYGYKGNPGLLNSIINTKLEKHVFSEKTGNTQNMVKELKSHMIKIRSIKGWKNAQCTSGGIENGELNFDTMETKKIPGLYFAGEIIDYDGKCGGFNLNNAWVTGMRAGKAMAEKLSLEKIIQTKR